MALECFDALLNWTNEHSLVKAIVTGSSDGTFTDEQLAATVIQRYFDSNPDLLPTAEGRRFFTYVGFQERAIVKFSIQRNLCTISPLYSHPCVYLLRCAHSPLALLCKVACGAIYIKNRPVYTWVSTRRAALSSISQYKSPGSIR